MKCVDCRWFHKENEICLKDGNSVFGIYIDGECEYVNNMTVFEKITVSPEVLASKLVYSVLAEDICTGTKTRYYHSTITGQRYDDETEAFDATLAKLKEVEK